MKVIGLTLEQVENIVSKVSKSLYSGNLRVATGRDRSKPGVLSGGIRVVVPRCTFTLGVLDSSAGSPGARCSSDVLSRGNGPHGRARVSTACWHAHFYVIERLVEAGRVGNVVVQTTKAVYSRDNFLDVAYATAFDNVGTAAFPVNAYELCECGPDEWPFEDDIPDGTSRLLLIR